MERTYSFTLMNLLLCLLLLLLCYYYYHYDMITFNVIRLTMLHTYTYKLPVILNYRLYAMIYVSVDRHYLVLFDISNLTQCPIHHSGYLQFNVALLFRYSKSEFK